MKSTEIHPLNYFKRRSFGRELVEWSRKAPVGEQIDPIVCRGFGQLLIDDLTKAGVIHEYDTEGLASHLFEELGVAKHVAAFIDGGRNIFSVSRHLLNLLEKTDANAVHVGDLRLPLRDFYILLPPNNDYSIGFSSPHRVTGCYVGIERNILYFRWTSDLIGKTLPWYEWEGWGAAGINLEDPHKTVGTAFAEWAEKQDTQNSEVPASAMNDLLALTANIICFIVAMPECLGKAAVYPDDAPREFVDRIKTGRPSKHGAARAELLKRGFSAIRILDVPAEMRARSDAATGHEVAAHWRRGHWRRQPYGTRLAEVRLLWIKPTIVRADKGQPQSGHLYTVDAR